MSARAAALACAMASLVACGGPSTDAAQAHVAARASEPRVNDPTAGQGVAVLRAAPAGGASQGPSGSSTPTSTSTSTTSASAAAELDPPKKISARHVLVQWMGSDRAGKSVLRTREQAMVLAKEVLRRAKDGEDIGRLAVEYSDEPNAGARGGSLGRFARGQMVPAFELVAFKLKVGEISEIVETPFGFHIIQRTE
jgi:parvulin-like peptidyl-prolyl isomerase